MTSPATEVIVRLDAPGAASVAPLPVDTGRLPGATVALAAAWVQGPARLDVACVRAPTALWLPGLEVTLLEAASARGRELLALDSLTPGPVEGTAAHRTQAFVGRAPGRVVSGRHEVGFVGADRDVLVCSLACSAPTAGACDALLPAATIAAPFEEAPAPAALVRGLLLALERPREVGGALVLVAALAVTGLLRFRPRPGRRRHAARAAALRRTP